MSTDLKWTSQSRKLSELKPANYNPRKLSDDQEKRLTDSIAKFDVCDPIIINADNTIIGGHQRIKVLKKQGIESVDVRVPSRQLSIDEEKELNVRLNKNLGEWDFALLKDFNIEMLKDAGFDSKDLDIIFKAEDTDQDDAVPEVPEEPVAKRGDIYSLGRHRIMCGDSTDAADVALLMDGKKADMVFTDPPYGVNYDGGHATDKRRRKLIGDDSVSLYEPACNIAFNFTEENSPLYLWHAGVKGLSAAAAAAAAAAGWEIRAEIIWNKNLAQYGAISAQYKQKHEPCFYCYKKGQSTRWAGGNTEITVWDISRASKNDFHPTQKPVELAVRAIGNHECNKIIDLFLGSGSTLIACEKTNRICYGMELDPHYIDVIIKRWEDFTGQKAIKVTNVQEQS